MGKKKGKSNKEKGKKPHSKSKHKNIQIHKKYKDGKVNGKWCPRCGPGVILAQHKDRSNCGKCGYSEISKKQ